MNFKKIFLRVWKSPIKKNWGYNRETVSSITRKTSVCGLESFYKIKLFPTFNQNFKNVKKIWKKSYGFKKINKFIWNKKE